MDTPLQAQTSDPWPLLAARQYGRWLLGLLLVSLLLVDLVALAVLAGGPRWPRPPGIAAMGLAFGQVGLAAVLLAWGGGPLWARGLVALALGFFAACLASASTPSVLPVWLGIMALDGTIVAAPLAIARLAGVRIVAMDEDRPPAGSRQFTIFGLLTLTTLVAVLLAIARTLSLPWGEIGAVALFALALGSIPWLCATLSLARFPWPVTCLAAALLCPLAGWLISLTGFPPPQPEELILMSYVQGALTVAACEVAGIAGCRLAFGSGQDACQADLVVSLRETK